MNVNDLLHLVIEKGASDLHIVPGYYPNIRVNGELFPVTIMGMMTPDVINQLLLPLLNNQLRDLLARDREIDFSYSYNNERFRVNYHFTRGALGASFRWIPSKVRSIDELGLPDIFHSFTKFSQGLVLFTGPTGEGKSTSLASLINEINYRDSRHILTIEDPIEFVYPQAKCVITQRELKQDTMTWAGALRSSLRQDPDVVLIGEMRDFDTIQAAITIAETGHLVFATLHTGTAPDAIDRIIDAFPVGQQNQIRSQLSTTLRAVVSQRLIPRADKTGRIAAVEILINIPAVASIIRDGKTHLLDNILETEERVGMILFEKGLARMHKQGLITREVAAAVALRPHELDKFIV